ncbi:MAG: flagellar basal body-associated FliL family protein [Hyphomonadaceae bacterium]|jgi:flagellar FliL protein|nr:flagellar basal body-associated FliL family protein [Hyphomonadaceae bacterium]
MAKEKKPKPEAGGEGDGADGAAPKKKLAGKQLILFIVLPAVLVLGGGGAAAFFLLGKKDPPAEAAAGEASKDGKGDEKAKKEDKKEKKEDKKGEKKDGEEGGGREMTVTDGPNGEAFLTLPDILVNVAGTGSRPAFLKLKVTLQVADAEVAEAIKPALPRVLDQYTGFLRELRMDDLQGSAGFSRLQLELLRRVNLAVAPAVVDAVLIEDMLVQ